MRQVKNERTKTGREIGKVWKRLTVHNDTRDDQDPKWGRELEDIFQANKFLRFLGTVQLHLFVFVE
jgi:hypothetical protein